MTTPEYKNPHALLRSIFFFLLSVPFLLFFSGCSKKSARPNIVIIFTDDQGYGDLSCYGSTSIHSPNLDKLAADGVRFTDFYVQRVCGPSRSALLTARYPVRSLAWSMPESEITFAELMQDVGYSTACIGKWDVSNRRPFIERMPDNQGFDYYFGPLERMTVARSPSMKTTKLLVVLTTWDH